MTIKHIITKYFELFCECKNKVYLYPTGQNGKDYISDFYIKIKTVDFMRKETIVVIMLFLGDNCLH